MVAKGMQKALSGDFRYWKEIMDRTDGKVLEQVDLTTGGEKFPGLSADELAAIAKMRGGPVE